MGITSIGPSLGIAAGFHPPPHLVSVHPGALLATYTGMPVRIGLLKGHSRNKITSPLNVRVVAEQEGTVQDSFPGAVRH
jgi:hypothetical protein